MNKLTLDALMTLLSNALNFLYKSLNFLYNLLNLLVTHKTILKTHCNFFCCLTKPPFFAVSNLASNSRTYPFF